MHLVPCGRYHQSSDRALHDKHFWAWLREGMLRPRRPDGLLKVTWTWQLQTWVLLGLSAPNSPTRYPTSLSIQRQSGSWWKTQIPGLPHGESDPAGPGQGPGVFIVMVVWVIVMHRHVCKWLVGDSWSRHRELPFLCGLAGRETVVGEKSTF